MLTHSQLDRITGSLESFGVEFVADDGGGVGVRLSKQAK